MYVHPKETAWESLGHGGVILQEEHHGELDKGSSSLSHQAVSGLGLERGGLKSLSHEEWMSDLRLASHVLPLDPNPHPRLSPNSFLCFPHIFLTPAHSYQQKHNFSAFLCLKTSFSSRQVWSTGNMRRGK